MNFVFIFFFFTNTKFKVTVTAFCIYKVKVADFLYLQSNSD